MSAKVREKIRRIARMVLVSFFAVLALILLALFAVFYGVQTEAGSDLLRRVLIDQLKPTLPGLAVGKIDVDLSGEITILDAELRDRFGGKAISVEKIHLRFLPWLLFSQTVAVESLSLTAPTVLLRRISENTFNLAELVTLSDEDETEQGAGEDTADWVIDVNALEIDRGRANLMIDAGQHYRVRSLSLRAKGRIDETFTVDLRAMQLKAQAPGQHNVSLSLKGQSRFSMSKISGKSRLMITDIDTGQRVRLDARANGPYSNLTTELNMSGSSVNDVTISGELGLSGPLHYVIDLDINGLGLAALRSFVPEMPPGRVNVSGSLSGEGVPFEENAVAKVSLKGTKTTVADFSLDSYAVKGSLKGKRWRLTRLSATRGDNTLVVTGRGHNLSGTADLKIDANDLSQLQLDQSDEDTSLAGYVSGDGSVSLTPQRELKAKLNIAAGSLTYNDKSVAEMFATINGSGTLDEPQVALDFTTNNVAIGDDSHFESITLNLIGNRERIEVAAKVTGDRLNGSIKSDILRQDNGRIVAKLLKLRVSLDGQTVTLKRPTEASYQLKTKVAQLRPTKLQVEGGMLSAQGIYDHLNQRLEDIKIVGDALPLKLVKLVEPELTLLGTLSFNLRASGAVSNPSLSVVADSEVIELTPLVQRLELSQSVTGPAKASIKVIGKMRSPSGTIGITFPKLKINRQSLDPIAINVSADSNPNHFEVNAALSIAAKRKLTLEGRLNESLETLLAVRSTDWPFRLKANINDFRLNNLHPFGGGLETMTGSLSAELKGRGKIGAPQLTASLKIRDGAIGQVPIEQILARLSYRGNMLQADGTIRQKEGNAVNITAALNVSESVIQDASLTATSFDLRFLSPLLPRIRYLAGKLNANLKAAGPFAKPVVEGTLNIDKATVHVSGMPRLEGISLAARVDEKRLILSQIEATSGSGSLRGEGSAILGAPFVKAFNLSAQLQRFVIGVPPIPEGSFTGRMLVSGQRVQDRFAIRAEFQKSTLRVPGIETADTLHATEPTLPDVTFVDKNIPVDQESSDDSDPPLNLSVQALAEPLFVRGEDLDLEVDFNIRMETDEEGTARIAGKAHINHGKVSALGNDFRVERGDVTFSKQDPPDPMLQIKLSRRFAEATVYVELAGPASNPKLSLTSDPPIYDKAQITSLLLTGRVDSRDSGSSTSTASAITSAVSQAVLGSIARKLAPKVGIDVARISVDETEGSELGATKRRTATAEFGKNVTRRIYVGYRAIFGAERDENSNEGILEYLISPHWYLLTVFGDAGVGSIDLLWTYRY